MYIVDLYCSDIDCVWRFGFFPRHVIASFMRCKYYNITIKKSIPRKQKSESSGNGKLPNNGEHRDQRNKRFHAVPGQTKATAPHAVDWRIVCWSEIMPSYWTPCGFRIRQSAFPIIKMTTKLSWLVVQYSKMCKYCKFYTSILYSIYIYVVPEVLLLLWAHSWISEEKIIMFWLHRDICKMMSIRQKKKKNCNIFCKKKCWQLLYMYMYYMSIG